MNKIICGEALAELKKLPDECADCIITSPPYYALRDYQIEGQLGLEPTFQEYISKLCNIFDEVKRVLKKTGTCWVNLGDTYRGSGKGAGGDGTSKESFTFTKKEKRICQNCGKEFIDWKFQNFCGSACSGVDNTPRNKKGKMQDKCLCQIPSRFAIEMTDRGWILRNKIIWNKPNHMPSSVKDRFSNSYEYIFLFSKQRKYYFNLDNVKVPCTNILFRKDKGNWQRLTSEYKNIQSASRSGNKTRTTKIPQEQSESFGSPRGRNYRNKKNKNINRLRDPSNPGEPNPFNLLGKNPGDVWTITTKPFKESHYAVFPPELPERCILAGCPDFVCKKCGKPREKSYKIKGENVGHKPRLDERYFSCSSGQHFSNNYSFDKYTDCNCKAGFEPGIVLDPFAGAGTTLLMAKKLKRQYIGIELNPEYIKLIKKRLNIMLSDKELKTEKETIFNFI